MKRTSRIILYAALGVLLIGAGVAYVPIREIVRFRTLHLVFPVPGPAGKGQPGLLSELSFLRDLSRFKAQVERRGESMGPELRPMAEEIARRQAAGKNVSYSAQIYREIRWLAVFTSDVAATRARIDELKRSLDSQDDQSFADAQSPIDGSWGLGYTAWFMKLYGTVNEAPRSLLQRPLSFLDRINSPDAMTAQLTRVMTDDFLKTGVLNRMEADETLSLLGRLILGDVECSYPFHARLKETYLEFVRDWQNPETGCWGIRFIARDGTVWGMDDVGMTFHVVSRLKEATPRLDRIAQRVLDLRGVDFPAGIRVHGHYENHLNWDAVKIFRFAWPHLDREARDAVRAETSCMLRWCLDRSFQPDGSFARSDLDDTFADAMEYGVCFLSEVGLFGKADRFWTDQDFPEARSIAERIKTRIEAVGLGTPQLKSAYSRLASTE